MSNTSPLGVKIRAKKTAPKGRFIKFLKGIVLIVRIGQHNLVN